MKAGGNIHTQTVEKIAAWIIEKKFGPGDRLPIEAALCTELGVSRTVVREAVKTLAAKGMVSTGPRIGTRLLPVGTWQLFDPQVIGWRMQAGIDAKFADDLIEFRLAIEPAAAKAAARQATASQRADLTARYEAMAEAVAGRGQHLAADLAFHAAILRATGNQFFSSLVPLVESVLSVSVKLSGSDQHAIESSLPLHRDVARAIVEGRADAAEKALAYLIRHARQDIVSKTPARVGAAKGAA